MNEQINIQQMNRPMCRIISNEVLKALKDVEQKFNIKFTRGNGSYSDTSYTMKLSANVIQDGEVLSPEATAFKLNAEFYGLKATDLRRTFLSGTQTFRIIGFNTRARKFKIVAEEVGTNKRYKFSALSVANNLR